MNQEPIHHHQGHHQPPPQQNPQQREDQAAMQLMAMAEHFRNNETPSYKAAAKCLIAASKTNASSYLKAHVHYQLGKLLYYYTRNASRAKTELETAHSMFQSMGSKCEEIRLICATMVAECALSLQDNQGAVNLLQLEAPVTRQYPKIHSKSLMLTTEALSAIDLNVAAEVANMGIIYYRDCKDNVMECYFRLVQCLCFARNSSTEKLGKSITELIDILNRVQEAPNINDMKACCYAIQLCYFLSVGLIIHSKRCLRELQIIVQNKGRTEEQISAATRSEHSSFSWLRKELLTGLTYGLTSLWSIQSGQFDKAERYFANSVGHLNELNAMMHKARWGIVQRGHERFLAHLHFAIHDGMAHMYLAKARPDKVWDMTSQMIRALRAAPKDLEMFEGQAHLIMGMYFQYMKDTQNAEAQLLAVEKTTKDEDLKVISKLSLCLMYLFQAREKEFYEYYDDVRPSKLQNVSFVTRAMSGLISALHSFVHGRLAEGKTTAVEAVQICSDKDIVRVQAIAMMLIARIYNNTNEVAVSAGLDWAGRAGDPHLHTWAELLQAELDEHRAKAENNYTLLEEAKQRRETARYNESQLAQHVSAAAEVALPKYATMLDYNEELGLSQWHGIY
uniref:Cohesin loading complex subunit SCC4 homolog n=1 Tax=Panagrellus redivivus TaxID=6233 RepID=A0A7E4V4Q8_PANRE